MATSIRPNLLQRRPSGSSPSPSSSPTTHLLPEFIVTARATNETWPPSGQLPTCPEEQHKRLKRSDVVEENGSLCCPQCGLEIAPVLIVEDMDGRQNVPYLYWLNGYRGTPDEYTFSREEDAQPLELL